MTIYNPKSDGGVATSPLGIVFERLIAAESRLAALEARINGPAICPDPTGEGSAWQGSPTPAEPAPGSDAKHPPIGYRLAKVGENRAKGYIYWHGGAWRDGEWNLVGDVITRGCANHIANPIPANEGDSQKAGLSEKIAESVVQDLQQACYDRDELRATVERLTAENASLEVENRTLRGLVRRMKEVLL